MIDDVDNQPSQWKVIFTDCFKEWFLSQDENVQDSVVASLNRL